MRGWILLLLCTLSTRAGGSIHPRYIDRVEEFSRRCGHLCVHHDVAQLKMRPVNQLEMYMMTGTPGIVGLARIGFLGGFAVTYEVYILDSLEGVMEDATIAHELFHALAGMQHTDQDAFSFMAPYTVEAEWYRQHWDVLWKNDLCSLAKERGYFDSPHCEEL